MFVLLVFTEVEPNTSNIFPGFCVWIIYRVPVSPLLVTVLVLAPLGSLIVSNHDDVVFRNLGNDKLDGFRFSFVQVG